MTHLHDDEETEVSSLQYIAGGVTHNGFTGNLFRSNPPFVTFNYADTYLLFASDSC